MIRQRGEVWYCILYIRGEDGKPRQKWISLPDCKTEKQARKEEQRLKAEKESGRLVASGKQTVRDYLCSWMEGMSHISAKTREGYNTILHAYVIPQIGTVRLTDLTPNHIRIMYNQLLETPRRRMKRPLSPRTVVSSHRVLRAGLNQAVKDGLLVKNPITAVKPPRMTKTKTHVMDSNETAELLEKLTDTPYFIPVLIAVSTGMRRGEILALRWSDIDLDRGTLTVNQATEQTTGKLSFKEPKTETSRRTLILPKSLIVALIRHRGEQSRRRLRLGDKWADHGLVVTRSNGKPISPSGFSHSFAALLERMELPPMRFHDLRHSYASALIQQGRSMKIISSRLGHSSIGITMNTYGHLLVGVEEEAVEGWDTAMQEALERVRRKRAANDE